MKPSKFQLSMGFIPKGTKLLCICNKNTEDDYCTHFLLTVGNIYVVNENSSIDKVSILDNVDKRWGNKYNLNRFKIID